MSAKTPWFDCGKCGFRNHPRPNAAPVLVRAADGRYDLVDGNSKCEQCGEPSSNQFSTDYQGA